MKPPFNTKKRAEENPQARLGEALLFGSENSILREEKLGQQSFTNSDTLPTTCYDRNYDYKKILETAGVKFLEVVEDDPIFQYVELPTGWKKVPTNHSMWSKLVDEKGREHAAIFYKAAFYDRSAHISLSCRYSYYFDYKKAEESNIAISIVKDGNKIIYTTEELSMPVDTGNNYMVRNGFQEQSNKKALKWLNENYPDWNNPAAYWD